MSINGTYVRRIFGIHFIIFQLNSFLYKILHSEIFSVST